MPVFAWAALPFVVDAILLFALVAALTVANAPKAPAWESFIPLGVIAVLAACDQSRLQPWVVTYGVVLFAIGFTSADEDRNAAVLMTVRFAIAIEYVWSGLQKANANFVDAVWPEFSGRPCGALHVPPSICHASGFAVSALEVGIGLLLFVPRMRRIGVIAACSMHAAILVSLIASGENRAVWPWNAAMPLFDVVVFWNAKAVPWGAALFRRFPAGLAIVLLVGFMPVLSFWGRWDAYASAALYSGNTPQAAVVVDPAKLGMLPPILNRNTWRASRPNFIDINRWSYEELQVPAYPEVRIFRAVGRELCRTQPAAVALVILGRPDWLSGRRSRTRFPCSDPWW